MRKQFMSASAIALMVLAATSCSKNETMPEIPGGEASNVEQISFRSSTGKTRANDFGLTDLESGFNVVGLTTDDNYVAGFNDPTGDAETYHKSSGAWGWKTTPTDKDKQWPTDGTLYPLTFFMAYPKTDVIKKGEEAAYIEAISNLTPNVNFVHNTLYEGTRTAVDLGADKVSVDELAAMTVVNTKPMDGFANLSFKHIMSNILFDVKVPTGVKAVIHSIKIANVNKHGRAYDYKTQTWGPEPAYADGNLTYYAHFEAADAAGVQTITSAADAAPVNGFSDGAAGFNTLKLMPQTVVTPWALGADATTPDSFKKDAAAWKAQYATVDATAITAWHNNATTVDAGMKDSKGWIGARIEVVYCLVDETNGKNLIGRFSGVDGATATQFVRVGYPLDLANLETKAAAGSDLAVMGLAAGYKYKFTISLGTADATNGILLDPDYKNETGDNTTTPVDNPKVTPGDPITKEGVINFKVAVDVWADYAGDIK